MSLHLRVGRLQPPNSIELWEKKHAEAKEYDGLFGVKGRRALSGISFHDVFHFDMPCTERPLCVEAWRPLYLQDAVKWVNENIPKRFRYRYTEILRIMQGNLDVWFVNTWKNSSMR